MIMVLTRVVALIMWGYGLVWMFFALASISRSKFPFNMGWWGFTFPLGVFTVAETTFGKDLPSTFFDVLGTVGDPAAQSLTSQLTTLRQIFSVVVTLLWLVAAGKTLMGACTGKLLVAPCLGEDSPATKCQKASDQ